MWIAVVAVAGAVAFLVAGYCRPRFNQPVLRAGTAADLLHVLVNGALLDVPIAALLQQAAATLQSVWAGLRWA